MLSKFLTRREQLVLLAVALSIGTGAVVLYLTRFGPGPEEAKALPAKAEQAVPAEHGPASEATLAGKQDTPTMAAARPASEPSNQSPASDSAPTAAEQIAVAIRGAVPDPGMYRLDAQSTVQNLIEEAGGAKDNADLSDINLAAPLIANTTLTIPRGPERLQQDDGTLVLRSGEQAADLNPAQYTISGWRNQSAASPAPAPAGKTSQPAGSHGSGLLDLNTVSAAQLESLPGIGPKLAEAIVQHRASEPFQSVDDLDKVHGIGPKRLEQVRNLVTVGGGT